MGWGTTGSILELNPSSTIALMVIAFAAAASISPPIPPWTTLTCWTSSSLSSSSTSRWSSIKPGNVESDIASDSPRVNKTLDDGEGGIVEGGALA